MSPSRKHPAPPWIAPIALGCLFLTAALAAAETLSFSVVGIDCKECAPPILEALREIPGVRNASLDWKAGTATVEVPEGFDPARIQSALDAIGYEAVFAGERRKDLQPLPDEVRKRLDIAPASEGDRIDIARVLVPGKITVLDYWAQWCSPCHLLDTRLQHLVQGDPRIAVRRINVGKWDNAAARQATREFRVEALPYVRVYDSSGKFVEAVTGGSWDKTLKAIEKARARSGA